MLDVSILADRGLPLLQAATAPATAAPGVGGLLSRRGASSMVFIVLMFVVLYFFMWKPQKKKQKEAKKMMESMHKGDRITTIGGLRGVIAEIRDNVIVVRVDKDVKLEFLRSAISEVIPSGDRDSDSSGDSLRKVDPVEKTESIDSNKNA